MKTIKDYNSFLNENKIVNEEFVDSDLDQEIIDYYMEITDSNTITKEEAINQVANDFGVTAQVVAVMIDAAGIKESVEDEEDEEDSINEANDEDIYLTPKQKNLPEGLKKGIIAKAKKNGKKVSDKKDDKKDSDKKSDKKDSDKKSDKDISDEKKYLSPKQRKLPEGMKKGIIKRAKKNEK